MADAAYLVDDGLAAIVGELVTLSKYKYVGWGTGATGAAVDDSALQTAAAPTTATAATGTPTAVTDTTYQVVGSIEAGGDLAITEVAIFSQATISGAVCFFHGTFSAINVTSGDSIEFTLQSVFNQA